MKKLLLPGSFFLLSFCLNAQYTIIKKKLTDIGIVNNSVSSMALQPDQKIIIAGSVQEGNTFKLSIIRYKQSGVLDSSFGNNGIDTFSVSRILPVMYQGAYLRSIVAQADGKILVAGAAWYDAGVDYLSNVLVMRLNQNGTLDNSFGDNGTVRSNINSSTGLSIDEANSIQLQTDGKIVIAGQTYDYIQHRFLIIKYNTDGSVDNSFGSGGVSTLAIGSSDDEAFAMAIQNNGKIILAGESYLSGVSYRVALVRYNLKGTLDTSFGNKGIVTTNLSVGTDEAKAIAIQSDNKIAVGGYTSNNNQTDAFCIRYNANGNIDNSFGNNGNVIIDVAGENDIVNAIQLQSDNKILLGGYSTSADSISEFLSIRLLPDGTKDSAYASGGILTTSFYQQGDAAYGMIVLPNGKILLGGQTTNGASQYISIIRYKRRGEIDSVFARNGKLITGIGSSDDVAYKMLRSPWDRSLYISGTANGYWVIAKYNSSTLSLDSSFGLNGVISVKYKNPEDPHDEPALALDAKTRKIYLAGYTGGQITIVRFNKDGIVDKTFGKNGAVNYELSLFYGGFEIESDHKILLAGVRQQVTSGYDFVARLKTNGTVDSSFGVNGEVQHLPITANSIQMKKDQSTILFGGRVNSGIGVLSLNIDGTYDQSFGVNGLVYKRSAAATAEVYFKYEMAQDQMGRILISGGVQGSNFNFQFSVTRFLKNGVIDSSFANKGLFVKDVSTGGFDDNYNEGISSYCSGPNCSVLTSGIKLNDGSEQSDAVIITLKNDGSIDRLNNTTGYIDTTFYNDKYEASYAALIDTIVQSNEIMFVAGKASNGLNNDFEVIKFQKPFAGNPINSSLISIDNYQLNVSPNPAHGNILITYNMPQPGNTEIGLTDFQGSVIQSQIQYNISGRQFLNMQLPSSLKPGFYFVTLSVGKTNNIYKLLVQ